MANPTIRIETHAIRDWESFHTVFADAFGFPHFYGRNMNAWIDCLSYVDQPETGMTSVRMKSGQQLQIELVNSAEFERLLPEIWSALVECTAFVNSRRVEEGQPPVLALVRM